MKIENSKLLIGLRTWQNIFPAFLLSIMPLVFPCNAQVIPYDDFEDGASDWFVLSGDWDAVDGEYHQLHLGSNGGATAYGWDMISFAGVPMSDDYFVQVDVRLQQNFLTFGGWAGIVFHFQDDQNYELISLYWNSAYIATQLCGDHFCDAFFLEYWTFTDREWYLVSSEEFLGDAFASHQLTVHVEGTQLHFFVDEEYAFTSSDQTGFHDGAVGLYTEDTLASFDNWRFSDNPEILDIELLIGQVQSLGLANGITNSLLKKLDGAVKILADSMENNNVAAANLLAAFINAVQAQTGGNITWSDAEALVGQAEEIIDQLLVEE